MAGCHAVIKEEKKVPSAEVVQQRTEDSPNFFSPIHSVLALLYTVASHTGAPAVEVFSLCLFFIVCAFKLCIVSRYRGSWQLTKLIWLPQVQTTLWHKSSVVLSEEHLSLLLIIEFICGLQEQIGKKNIMTTIQSSHSPELLTVGHGDDLGL